MTVIFHVSITLVPSKYQMLKLNISEAVMEWGQNKKFLPFNTVILKKNCSLNSAQESSSADLEAGKLEWALEIFMQNGVATFILFIKCKPTNEVKD